MKLILCLVAVVLAASCSAPPPDVEQATIEPNAFPVTFDHQFGSTVLEKLPTRVVNVGVVDQDAFLALGVVPVGTTEWFGKAPGALFPWAQPKLGSHPLPEVLPRVLDFARIAALKPDLITALYAELKPEEYQKLSEIAPTLAYPAEYGPWGIPWQQITKIAARALGRPTAADALIEGVQRSFDATRRAHPEFEGRAAALVSGYGWPASFYALGYRDGRVRFLQGLGFANPKEFDVLSGDQFGVPVSHDNLILADRDLVIWMTENPAQQAMIKSDAAWIKTRAFQQGRDVYLPADSPYYAALNFASVLSLPYAIAGLVPSFQAAIDGNPATP